MLSKLRRSFRRKLSRHQDQRGSDADIRTASLPRHPAAAARISATSLNSGASSLNSSISSLNSSAISTSFGSLSTLYRTKGCQPSLNHACQWQKVTPSVIESNRIMFQQQLNCDVIFVVGEEGALIGAHRFVLLARSDVFFRMFHGPLAEIGPVVVPDVSEDVFRQFLKFLYVDEIFLTADNVTPLHYLGRKYDVEPLVQQCLEFLHARLTSDNACSILEQAHCFDEHELYKASFEFIRENIKDCLASVAVQDLCRVCLERLLSLDELEITEQMLFKAALAWAETSLEKKHKDLDAEKVRKELGGVIHLIRFPAMTFEVLEQSVFPTGVLSTEEVKAIVEYKKGGRSSPSPFGCRGRQRVLHRFKKVSRVLCNGRLETSRWIAAITFSCDRDFFLHGLEIFACAREAQHVDVKFSILQGQDDLNLYNHMCEYNHSFVMSGDIDGTKTLTVTMETARKLDAMVDYTLVLQANMMACFEGTGGMATVTCDDVSFRFRDAKVKLNGTTVSEGQIPCLIYSVR